MTSTFLAYPHCYHSNENKDHYRSNQKTRLFCKLPNISESIDKYESQGYYIIGVIIDDDLPLVEILYDPTVSNPKTLDHIHGSLINDYIDEEIQRNNPYPIRQKEVIGNYVWYPIQVNGEIPLGVIIQVNDDDTYHIMWSIMDEIPWVFENCNQEDFISYYNGLKHYFNITRKNHEPLSTL